MCDLSNLSLSLSLSVSVCVCVCVCVCDVRGGCAQLSIKVAVSKGI